MSKTSVINGKLIKKLIDAANPSTSSLTPETTANIILNNGIGVKANKQSIDFVKLSNGESVIIAIIIAPKP